MRCAGYDWVGIEALLAGRANLDEVGVDQLDRRLMQRVELGEWAGIASVESWKWNAARELYPDPAGPGTTIGKTARLCAGCAGTNAKERWYSAIDRIPD